MHVNKKIEFANFGMRAVAFIIDFFLIILIWVILARKILFGIGHNFLSLASDNYLPFVFIYLLFLPAFIILYRSLFECSKLQGTPGKKILGIKVVNHQFQRIPFHQSVVRNVTKIFSSILYIGYLMALISEKSESLHDKVAKTFVIREVTYFSES